MPSDEVQGPETIPVLPDAAACKSARSPRGWGKVKFQTIRTALDWAKLLYRQWPSEPVWKALESAAVRGELDLVMPDGECLSLKVARKGWGIQVWGSGLRLEVRRRPQVRAPRTTPADPVRALNQRMRLERARALAESEATDQPYGVVADVQGSMLCGSCDGFDVLDGVRTALESHFYPDVAPTCAERRRALAPVTFLGRFDIALDTAISGDGASAWIEREMFCRSNVDRAKDQWSTRARSQDQSVRMKGGEVGGRTLYIGAAPMLVRTYEKDRHWGEERGASAAIQATLRRCGWNGTDRVLRTEVETHRAWLRDQEFDGLRGHLIPIDQLLASMPVITAKIAVRYRHTDGKRSVPVKRRPTSRYWTGCAAALARFESTTGDAMAKSFKELRSVKRKARIEGALDRAARAVIVLEASGSTPHEAIRRILATRNDPRRAEQYAEHLRRMKRELGRAEPEPAASDGASVAEVSAA